MARVTHVKKAQQRYETVVVRDADGAPVRTPVMKTVRDRETGESTQVQKTTKTGRPVFMTQSVADRSKPKEPYTCDFCRKPIEVGTPYKHITPKSGPYGGTKKTRHESCPTWQVWEYSNSLSAQLAQIAHSFNEGLDGVESTDDVSSLLSEAAEEVRSIAEQKRESASAMEDGFGQATSVSEQLEETADSLDEWADEIEQADVPDIDDCEDCDGTGQVDVEDEDVPVDGEQEECTTCSGSGEDMDAWRDKVRDEVTIVDESPV